jgi:hypothetical protein
LSEAAAKHWRAIVASKHPRYFDAANQVLLEVLCEHMSASDWVAAKIRTLDPNVPKNFPDFERLLMMSAREGRAIMSLMTKLKLLPTGAGETDEELLAQLRVVP